VSLKRKLQYFFKIRICFLPFAVCCLLAAVYSLSGCATSSDIESLKQDISTLQKDSLTTKGEVISLKEKTADVAKEESFNIVRQGQAEMQTTISNLSKDIQMLNGRFDENKYFIEKTLKDTTAEMDLMKVQITSMESRIKEMRDRLNALEGRMKEQKEPSKGEASSNGNMEEPQKEAQTAEAHPAKTTSADHVVKYEAAYAAFKNRKYKEAREKFEAYIKEFPKEELSDNAHFWIAETYYNEKDYEGAILAYETFLKKYPRSRKATSALLKQGLSFLEIGDKKTAKVIFEQVIEKYPDSKEAETAKKQIEGLIKKPVKKKR
jgi:tol-pal system protein YbgF